MTIPQKVLMNKSVWIVKYPSQKQDPLRLPKQFTKVVAEELTKEVREHAITVQKEVREKVFSAIAAAFAFVIALTWNETIKSVITKTVARLSIPQTTYFYDVIVALIVTTICVIGILLVSKYSAKK